MERVSSFVGGKEWVMTTAEWHDYMDKLLEEAERLGASKGICLGANTANAKDIFWYAGCSAFLYHYAQRFLLVIGDDEACEILKEEMLHMREDIEKSFLGLSSEEDES